MGFESFVLCPNCSRRKPQADFREGRRMRSWCLRCRTLLVLESIDEERARVQRQLSRIDALENQREARYRDALDWMHD